MNGARRRESLESATLHCFYWVLSGKHKKTKKNALVFAQMEGRINQKVQENGPPEGQKCCRGSKFKVATLGNAGCNFCIQDQVLVPEMDPAVHRKLIVESLLSKRFLK